MSVTRGAFASHGSSADDPWCFRLPYRTVAEAAKEHRHKASQRRWPVSAMVARPVGKREISENPLAKAAMDKEWKKPE
jgi:hypothetical protein